MEGKFPNVSNQVKITVKPWLSCCFLFPNFIGLQIDQERTSNPLEVPGINLHKCRITQYANHCPETCINNGDWKYRNHKGWPKNDTNGWLYWKLGKHHGNDYLLNSLKSSEFHITFAIRYSKFLDPAPTITDQLAKTTAPKLTLAGKVNMQIHLN